MFGLGFQHLPRDLAKVNAWKTMFDPYNKRGYSKISVFKITRVNCIYCKTLWARISLLVTNILTLD